LPSHCGGMGRNQVSQKSISPICCNSNILFLNRKTIFLNVIVFKRQFWATSTYPFVILWVNGLLFGRANDDITPMNPSFANSKLHVPIFLKSFLIASFK
jgi:hypothetical protein